MKLARQFAIALTVCIFVSALADEQDTHNPIEKIRMRNALSRVGKEHIRLTVNITAVQQDGQSVQVKWSGVHNPSFDDWIGVLAPADAEVPQRAPVKYKLASSDFSHVLRGEGKLSFSLENHRTDMRIAFFRNGFENPHMVAETEVIRMHDINRPSHGRISLTADPSEMLVQWTTGDSQGGWVKWGEQPGNYTWKAEARDLTYTKSDMCGGAAAAEGWLEPGVFHYALLTALQSSTRYYYVFGDESTGWSDEFSFRSAPEVGPDTSVSILCLADLGQAETDGSNEQSEMLPSLNTTSLMLADSRAQEYQLIVHHGDISYARGYVTQWDRYHEQMEPLVANIPYMTSIGNHERDWPSSGDRFPSMTDSGGECGVAHERRFLMPSSSQDAPWYSFDFGPIHFLHYSTEHVFAEGSKQWEFIKTDLKAVNRSLTPWVIVGGHRPIYIDSTNAHPPDGDQPVAEDLRAALEQLLLDYKVDITLQGHHHSYQRTCPVFQGKCVGYGDDGVANGPIHLVIGNAGAVLCLNVNKVQPEIFEKIFLWWGYTRLHANGTTLHFQMVSDLDGSIIDELVLRKPPGWGERWHRSQGSWPPPRPQKRPKWWWEQDLIPPPLQAIAAQQARLALRDEQLEDADHADLAALKKGVSTSRVSGLLRSITAGRTKG